MANSQGEAIPHVPKAPAPPLGGTAHSALTDQAKAALKLLVIDDDHTIRETCATVLQQEGYDVTTCGRGEEALQLIRRRRFDILLLDLYMTQVPGLELLKACLEAYPESVAVMMTGNPSLQTNIEALRLGAMDYLPKPFSASHLKLVIDRAALTALVAREGQEQRARMEREHGHDDDLVLLGSSPAFMAAINLAKKVAVTDASVFITGESGTGKELIAQFIHQQSRRRSREFVAINCAAIPEPLLESELFGHVKGAFTGAERDKLGLLETANGGTFFFDELTEMPTSVQVKLLRVIQDGRIRRVGSAVPMDSLVAVRFIAATNRDPAEAVAQGVLRKDLYYRLHVVPMKLPPLRERLQDIPILASHFLARFWRRNAPAGTPQPTLAPASIRALQSASWPGNVRELQNVIEHALVLASPGREIQPEDLPFFETGEVRSPLSIASHDVVTEEDYHTARDRMVSHFERTYLLWLVERAQGNISQASRIAGVDRTTLYRLMEKHKLGLIRQVPKGADTFD